MATEKSPYEQISEAVQEWLAGHQRSREYMLKIVAGFIQCCEIPNDRIRFLQWNGAKGYEVIYSEPKDGSNYTAAGAMVFDEEEETWRLGVRIVFVGASVFFPLIVSERGGMASVQIGPKGKPSQINANDMAQCYKFSVDVVEQIKRSFSTEQERPMGFIRTENDADDIRVTVEKAQSV